VFSGMLGVTLFGLLLTPVFFYIIQRSSESRMCASPIMRQISALLWGLLNAAFLGIPYVVTQVRRRRKAKAATRIGPPVAPPVGESIPDAKDDEPRPPGNELKR
jgi:multidrug efflux pump